MKTNMIYNMDCLEGMAMIDDGSVDMILCDLPYGVTDCKWDSIVPFEPLWTHYKRVIKDNGAIVLTGSQPFTTALIMSNRKWFRYCWYWFKNTTTGFPFAKKQPLRCVEEAAVFYKRPPLYSPQGLIRLDAAKTEKTRRRKKSIYGTGLETKTASLYTNYPRQVLQFKSERGYHPTQKPIPLFEYFIRTYTQEGELVLDNCMGSGTTAIACLNAGRRYIGFETDPEYYAKSLVRIEEREKELSG